jgi:nucleotide-binding universal stress UspA family protein
MVTAAAMARSPRPSPYARGEFAAALASTGADDRKEVEMFERIVVPLDGSEFAERALPHAEELARLTGAPLHVVRLIDLSFTRYGPYLYGVSPSALEQSLEDEERAAREYVGRVVEELRDRGLQVSSEVRHGSPERDLAASSRPDDLIVMATHGRGGMTRWFLGSVAEEVVRRSPVPVMLVRVMAAEATNGHLAEGIAVTPGATAPAGNGV